MSDDDDYPDLDFESDEENQAPTLEYSVSDSHIQRHLLGAPPDSYLGTLSDEQTEEEQCSTQEYEDNSNSFMSNETSPFPVDDEDEQSENQHEQKMAQDEIDPRPEDDPVILINAENEIAVNLDQITVNAERHTDSFMQLFLPAALISQPLELRDGYTPDVMDKCLKDMVGFDLLTTVYILVGTKEFENLKAENKLTGSRIECAYVLERYGWLKKNDKNRFFPVIPDSQKDFIEQLIDGAEYHVRMEEDKKKNVEAYASLEDELRAMYTYNMVCRLMVAYQLENKVKVINYQHLSNAFVSMVTHEKYTQVYEEFKSVLPLKPDEIWNPEWWKKYTGRSALKKFIEMPAYSGIATNTECGFYFRTERVTLFSNEDKKAVEEKWRNQGKPPQNDRKGGYGERGRNHNENGRTYQNQKRPVVPDPNFVPSTVTGGMSGNDDDGSLEPVTSAPRRRSPTNSPVRPERRGTPDTRDPEKERAPGPQTTVSPASRPADPFGGPPVRMANPFDGAFEERPTHRKVEDYGYSSSEEDFSSCGEYSDEDEKDKAARVEKRAERERRKKRRAEEKLNRPSPKIDNSRNRFNHSTFPKADEPSSPTSPSRSGARDQSYRQDSVPTHGETSPPASPTRRHPYRQPSPPRRQPSPPRRQPSPSRRQPSPSRRQTSPPRRQPSPPRRQSSPDRRFSSSSQQPPHHRNEHPVAPLVPDPPVQHSHTGNGGLPLHISDSPPPGHLDNHYSIPFQSHRPTPRNEVQHPAPSTKPKLHPGLKPRQQPEMPRESSDDPIINRGFQGPRRTTQQAPARPAYRGVNSTRPLSPVYSGRDDYPRQEDPSSLQSPRELRPHTSYQPVDQRDEREPRPMRNQSEHSMRDPPQNYYHPERDARDQQDQPFYHSRQPQPPQQHYPNRHAYQHYDDPSRMMPPQHRQSPMESHYEQPRHHPYHHHPDRTQPYMPDRNFQQPPPPQHQPSSYQPMYNQQQQSHVPVQQSYGQQPHYEQPTGYSRTLMSRIGHNPPMPPQVQDRVMYGAPTGYHNPNQPYPCQQPMPPPPPQHVYQQREQQQWNHPRNHL